MDFKKMFDLWKKVLTKPAKTFKQQRRKASLSEGAKHIVVAGVIAGVILAIIGLAGASLAGLASIFNLATFGAAGLLALIIILPIMGLVSWLISSGIYYVIALLLGGKGKFTLQSYLIALYTAPILIITYALFWIPVIGWVIVIFPAIYSLYLLTLSLKEAHKFSTGRAVLVWLLPMIIAMIIVFIFVAALVGLLIGSGLGGSGLSF